MTFFDQIHFHRLILLTSAFVVLAHPTFAANPDQLFRPPPMRLDQSAHDHPSLRTELPSVSPPSPILASSSSEEERFSPTLNSVISDDETESPIELTAATVCPDQLFCLSSPNGNGDALKFPTVRVTGFFQADAVWGRQDPENRNADVDGAPLGDIQDGADFRRARLAATGDVFENVGYMIEMDFAFPGRPSFMDVYLDLRDVSWLGNVRVGHWRQPFGLDALTSVRELLFLERALPFAFVPFRQIGAGFYDNNDELGLTWAASVFRYPCDPFGGNVGDDGGYGFAGRVTWLALQRDERSTLHLGGNFSFADPANDLVRFRNQPELFVGETAGSLAPVGVPPNLPVFVDTGDLPSNNFALYGAELAGSLGSFFAQSEFLITTVNRIGAESVTFWGAYAQIAYVLTGEYHPYNAKNGVYTRVVPNRPVTRCGGCGAWELAARWSIIDLDDKDVTGNELQNLTAGLNWYLNKNTKFQFNYIHSFLDSLASGRSDADLFALRAQLDF